MGGGDHKAVVRGEGTRSVGPATRTTKRRRCWVGSCDREHGRSREANPKYRESVFEALGLKEYLMGLMSPGMKDADRDDDSLPKLPGG